MYLKPVSIQILNYDLPFLIPTFPSNLSRPVNNIHTDITMLVITGMLLKSIQTHVATESYIKLLPMEYRVPQVVLHNEWSTFPYFKNKCDPCPDLNFNHEQQSVNL